MLYLGATLGALYKGMRAISGVFYEEATVGKGQVAQHQRRRRQAEAEPRRTESEPPGLAGPGAKLHRQPRAQVVRAEASAAF